MADSAQWVKHIESFVDSSSSPSQQNANIDAIAALLKNDLITIEILVREMEMYLTTTDHIIRSRGILLLAELLTRLSSKPLDDTSVCSLIGFFTERLADWKALRGALVGCLALLMRKSNGMVTLNEAKAVAQCFLENVSVQSLGQHDRKLCFELLECLLRRYPDAVVSLGDHFLYGICEAIDNEQDPLCLLIIFHIIEVLGRLLPEPCGPLANLAADIFEVLGRYFPIHFTHPKAEEVDVKRNELSRALMLAFASTPFFEPFVIPLLLEKLSSSLPSSKVEALRYLSHCSMEYGADRMSTHYESLWAVLKNTIFNSAQPISSLELGQGSSFDCQENEIATEAFILLQKLVKQDSDVLSSLIVGDREIKLTINSIKTFESYADISSEHKQKLHAVGRIFSACAKASTVACNKMFESFFLCLMNTLGLSGLARDNHPKEDHEILGKLNYGALYLCFELLVGCRYLVVGLDELSLDAVYENEAWCCLLQNFWFSLTEFCFVILNSSGDEETRNVYICAGVKILQILATFPGSFLPISRSLYENILTRLMSIIKLNSHQTFLWKSSLKALVVIGSFVGKRNESEKAQSFMGIVVDDLSSWISSNDTSLALSFKLEAISEIGTIGMNFMLAIAQGLERAVFTKLSQILVHGRAILANSTIELLECLSNKVLPWIGKHGGLNNISYQIAINIWELFTKEIDLHIGPQKEALLRATMTSLKLAVANCSEECQSIIVDKAFNALSSCSFILLGESTSTIPTKLGVLKLGERDEWIISLFSSVVIALRPQTQIPNIKATIYVLKAALVHGHLPVAQALGSILNKLPLKANTVDNFAGVTLEEVIDVAFSTNDYSSDDSGLLRRCSGASHVSEINLAASNNRQDKLQQIHVICRLAWIGKGLIMRGHEKIKDVTMILLSCLLSSSDIGALSLNEGQLNSNNEQDILRFKTCAADAFQILMTDSEDCLNRRFHAVIRPLYKQRYFSTVMPILLSSMVKTEPSITRSMLHRAIAHIISNTPVTAILSEAKKLIPVILDGLSMLSEDITNKEMVYGILLVLSGILTDKNGQEAVVENAHLIISHLVRLVSYPHMMLVRETAILCLVAMSTLPHARIYPMRTQVLRAMSNALDDPKRPVRQEAVRCRRAWA